LHSFFGAEDLFWFTPASEREIQIVDENGNECATDLEGELRTRTTDIDCSSYVDDDEATSKVFRDGFFYPGDMAVRRWDGRIRILGRTADVLIVQATKIPVAPLENEIKQALQVNEVCVFSGLNSDGGEELVVAIESDRDQPQAELNAVALKLPKVQRVRFTVLKEFPRADIGMRKTQRAALRKLVFPEKKESD
jgi:acyl-CoA synthetase (AMP-forming)/AMP-acid ligase II